FEPNMSFVRQRVGNGRAGVEGVGIVLPELKIVRRLRDDARLFTTDILEEAQAGPGARGTGCRPLPERLACSSADDYVE
ncbi:MAG: hypothetical protein ACE5IY_06245, partial [bacterium]